MNNGSTTVTPIKRLTVDKLIEIARSLHVPASAILPDAWATETQFDQEDGNVIHAADIEAGRFRIRLDRALLSSATNGLVDYGTEATVSWEATDVSGESEWREVLVGIRDIPELVEALQRAHDVATKSRAVRRPANVDDNLRNLDD